MAARILLPAAITILEHRNSVAARFSILIFVNKFSDLFLQKILYLYGVVHISVTKKRHRINSHILLLIKTPTEPFVSGGLFQ